MLTFLVQQKKNCFNREAVQKKMSFLSVLGKVGDPCPSRQMFFFFFWGGGGACYVRKCYNFYLGFMTVASLLALVLLKVKIFNTSTYRYHRPKNQEECLLQKWGQTGERDSCSDQVFPGEGLLQTKRTIQSWQYNRHFSGFFGRIVAFFPPPPPTVGRLVRAQEGRMKSNKNADLNFRYILNWPLHQN